MVDIKEMRKMSSNLGSCPDHYMESFRENVRMYIDHKSITITEICETADISESTFKSFIYGKSNDVHLGMAVKLAKVFQVSVDELVGCGTISPQTCDSLQTVRQLPESMTHFVRWAIHYHYDMLNSQKVSIRAIEIMNPEVATSGNLKMTNDLSLLDISDINDEIRPKIFMGIKIPTSLLEPVFYEGDILLLANDRNPFPNETVVITTNDNIWIVKRKEEIVDGVKIVKYVSLRDGQVRAVGDDGHFTIGYVVKVLRNME